MNQRTKQITVAIVAVSAAAIALHLALANRPEPINLGTYEVLGAVAAEEAARLVGGQGRVVVVVRDTGPDKNPSVEAELKAFEQTLRKSSGLSAIVERVTVNPMMMMATGGGLPAEELFRLIEKNAKVDAVVLFFGFPPLTDMELAKLKETGAKVIVVSSLRPGYQRLLERQAIHLAIVPRPDPPPADARPAQTVRERFDQEYLILKAEDGSALP
ncbi:MAG: hypothetical protein KJ070_11755 [Verrucomicrobia bacterium]|nr:hypothetical protein [Verrucomicrobiota bacterium]